MNILLEIPMRRDLRKSVSLIYIPKRYNGFVPLYKITIYNNNNQTPPIAKSSQSQKHGFIFENEIRQKVFKLPSQSNNRDIHDISHNENALNSNENISIKSTGTNTICCGDVLRFYDYDFNKINTIICIKYIQNKDQKNVERIYEVNYNRECHKLLFGDLQRHTIKSYVDGVKSIPSNVGGVDTKNIYNYIHIKNKINNEHSNTISINPKVDSKQSRVQCSIPKFETTLKDFITYKSTIDNPNRLRGVDISLSISSCTRNRL